MIHLKISIPAIPPKFLRIFFISIWSVMVVCEIVIVSQLMIMNVLPTKYLLLLIGIFLLVSLILGVLLPNKPGKYQKKTNNIYRYIASGVSAVLIVLCLIGSSVIAHINGTLSAVTAPATVNSDIHVYVLTDDPAQTIEDAKDYTFGVTDSFNWNDTQKGISILNDKLNSTITTENYSSAFTMADALYAGEIGALILHGSYLDILEEVKGYTDFSDKTRLLFDCTFELSEQTYPDNPASEPVQEGTLPPDETPVIDNPHNSFLLYISGSDSRTQALTNSRSDVNIIAAVNPTTKQILLINTPRDYYVNNPAGGGAKDKLTHCSIYGIDCSRRALETLYGRPIAYYARINFTGFETLINAVGGVTVHSDVSFTTRLGKYRIEAGNNYLNGHQALCFARERYALANGDIARGENQMKVISAVIDKLSASTIISNYSQILNSLSGMFTTTMPQAEISSLIRMQLDDMAKWNVKFYTVTGYNGYDVNYSMPGFHAYVMYPDQSTVDHATALIDKVFAGETLTSKDVKG